MLCVFTLLCAILVLVASWNKNSFFQKEYKKYWLSQKYPWLLRVFINDTNAAHYGRLPGIQSALA